MKSVDERYYDDHPGSLRLAGGGRRAFPDGATHDSRWITPFPIYMTRSEGAHKWDVDGNRYVDYVVGHGAILLGHSHPAIVEAVREQMGRGTHVGGATELEIRWAEIVNKLVPCSEKVRFHSSGTEADLMAFRLVRAYTGRDKILKFHHHFHGWSDYVVLSPEGEAAGVPQGMAETVVQVAPEIGEVERALDREPEIAAVILEPTGAFGGMLPVTPGFLRQLRDVTLRAGVLLIFDEVITGFRTSLGGVQGRYEVTPDLSTHAKILAGGLPGAAVVGKAEILDMIQHRGDPEWDARRRVAHPGTFNANPLSAVAGATCLEILDREPVNERVEAMTERLKSGLNGVLAGLGIPGFAYGLASGVFVALGVEGEWDEENGCTVPDATLNASKDPARAGALRKALLNEGVDIQGGWSWRLTAAHTEEDVDFSVEAYEKALRALLREGWAVSGVAAAETAAR